MKQKILHSFLRIVNPNPTTITGKMLELFVAALLSWYFYSLLADIDHTSGFKYFCVVFVLCVGLFNLLWTSVSLVRILIKRS